MKIFTTAALIAVLFQCTGADQYIRSTTDFETVTEKSSSNQAVKQGPNNGHWENKEQQHTWKGKEPLRFDNEQKRPFDGPPHAFLQDKWNHDEKYYHGPPHTFNKGNWGPPHEFNEDNWNHEKYYHGLSHPLYKGNWNEGNLNHDDEYLHGRRLGYGGGQVGGYPQYNSWGQQHHPRYDQRHAPRYDSEWRSLDDERYGYDEQYHYGPRHAYHNRQHQGFEQYPRKQGKVGI